MTSQKLQVAVFLESSNLKMWHAKIVEDLKKSEIIDTRVIIINNTKSEASNFSSFTQNCLRIFEKIDRKLFPIRSTDLTSDTRSEEFASNQEIEHLENPEEILNSNLDVVLNLCPNYSLDGEKYLSIKHGIWQINLDEIIGTMPGFYEVINKKEVMDVSISASAVNGKKILKRLKPATDILSSNQSVNIKFAVVLKYPRLLLEELANSGQIKSSVAVTKQIKLGKSLKANEVYVITKLIKHLLKIVRFQLGRINKGQWFLAYSVNNNSPLEQKLEDYKILFPPPDRFWADPICYNKDGKDYIFFEDLRDDFNGKGVISVIKIDQEGQASEEKIVLEHSCHLSYPFIFEYEGETYMLPETVGNKTVEIHKAVDFPYEWELEKVLMEDVNFADVTIFEYNKRWWMFAAGRVNDEIGFGNELYIFFADTPFGKWQPHPQNPVICDGRKARPGGPVFKEGNTLYRPSQDCSYSYGRAININKIIQLDEEGYEEETVKRYEPWSKGFNGIHTFSTSQNLTVVDGLRRISKIHRQRIKRLLKI